MDSRFMTAALTGTATDRNTAISSRNDSITTPPITQGNRCERWLDGVDGGRGVPADQRLHAGAATAGGTTWSRGCGGRAVGPAVLGRRRRDDDEDGGVAGRVELGGAGEGHAGRLLQRACELGGAHGPADAGPEGRRRRRAGRWCRARSPGRAGRRPCAW